MPSPSEDVQQFLENTREAEGRALDVAIVYARSMVAELRASIADWEAAEARLREIKGRCVANSN
jgi:hypothetical protein